MKRNEQEKPTAGSEDYPGSSHSVSQEEALPDINKMTPEEMKNYLDDLFREHILSEG
jgi:hypothetical protein